MFSNPFPRNKIVSVLSIVFILYFIPPLSTGAETIAELERQYTLSRVKGLE